jgi:hypothetical protein
MNAWGIPDWREPKAYGNSGAWNFFRWRWEFYRRRPDLREMFTKSSNAPSPELSFAFPERPPKGESGHYACAPDVCRDKFGYWPHLPDPSIGDHPSDLLFVFPKEMPKLDDDIQWDNYSAMEHLEQCGLNLTENQISAIEHLNGAMLVPFHKGKTFMAFDLEQPIEPQLAIAKRYLQMQQRDQLGRNLQARRRHPAKWLTYLRVLDAREAGASWSKIASILPRTARTDQTARDTWEQAQALCFNF